MIYALKGKILERLNKSIALDVNSVVYEVFVGSKDIQSLIQGAEIFLYTQLIITENEHTLYGFTTANSVALFKLLRTVPGIGPKSAFNILDAGSTSEIISAISNADKTFFKKVSGVGPKSALKIIVELQDKVGKIKELDLSPVSKQDEEIVDALQAMGYDRDSVLDVLSEIEETDVSKKLQSAIKVLSAKNA